MPRTTPPRVSVIIPAYNAMPELTRCVTSVMEQTLGPDEIEIIAVDDGSTDGTGRELDRLAQTCSGMHVVHRPNSGGAGVPRNTGLDRAAGDYVFFLDSDDYLGPDALRRMVTMADENHTDVVLGKMVSVGGRAVPTAVFSHNQPRTDVFSSAAYRTLGCWKLFRRSLIERLNLRFPPYRNCEDKPFTAAAYLNADGISVVADYDCYYSRNRQNGNNLTRTAADLVHRMDGTRLCFETVARYLEPGPRQDRIMRRHVEWELCGPLRALLPRESEQRARELFYPQFRHWARNYVSDGVFQSIAPQDRLIVHLLRADRFEDLMSVARHAKEDEARGHVVDKGRVYWSHPFFRDPAKAVPDACFDATSRIPVHHELAEAAWAGDGDVLRLAGHAHIESLGSLQSDTRLILRPSGFRHPDIHVPTTVGTGPHHGQDAATGFTADVDLDTVDWGVPLGRGRWDLYLDVRAQGVSRTVRLRRARTDANGERHAPPQRHLAPGPRAGHGRTIARPFFTPHGDFSLDLREAEVAPICRVTGIAWDTSGPATLVVAGRLTDDAAGRPVTVLRAEEGSGSVREVPLLYARDGSPAFTARLPVRKLPPGRWTLTLRTDDPGSRIPVPPARGLSGTRWFRASRLGRPYYAKPLPGSGTRGALVLRVAPVRLTAAALRRVKDISRWTIR
ncbi:Glycosyltransferase involved in cell wall bisynthesis [Streptomyces sp. Ag82_O1-12]|uniref:glycosyltransferase family 2 protein n=1 Tax=unclassified Streptomyces TaxID=2593676 RepID=UPI000BC6AE8A|nr:MULTISPECIES: glycosyltransferase family 2 protein [unclassified Streptomyces]SMQ13888.1 Glycosyltransferase involved in cell wall bisynthesis [Streptomyces sp. Ag82_O1-12]SOD42918.1 Glycosyltransferase involved in cell wall bisynthesis [Streptomyces sp. Ag82_G6-1]